MAIFFHIVQIPAAPRPPFVIRRQIWILCSTSGVNCLTLWLHDMHWKHGKTGRCFCPPLLKMVPPSLSEVKKFNIILRPQYQYLPAYLFITTCWKYLSDCSNCVVVFLLESSVSTEMFCGFALNISLRMAASALCIAESLDPSGCVELAITCGSEIIASLEAPGETELMAPCTWRFFFLACFFFSACFWASSRFSFSSCWKESSIFNAPPRKA